MSHTIISVGEVLWDLFPDGERFGGAPANFACHAAIQGADVAMVSAVGDDEHGRRATTILGNYGIDVGLLQVVSDKPTGTVGIELDDKGKPEFSIHEGSAWDYLVWNDNIANRIATAQAVYFGTLAQRNDVSRATIRRAIESAAIDGVRRVLDINLRPPFFTTELIRESVQCASILKLSDDELQEVCLACGISVSDSHEAALRSLLGFGDLEMVVMTRGANGAMLVTADQTVEQAGIPTNVIDTVGAGDAFTAAFLLAELNGRPYAQCLQMACEIAAATCAVAGAVP